MSDLSVISASLAHDCPICDASGSVLVRFATHYDQAEYDECPACGGVGRLDEEGHAHALAVLSYERDWEDQMDAINAAREPEGDVW